MPTGDLQINSRIREILVRHWVDAEKLQFRTTAGTVRFYGVLARQGSSPVCDINQSLMETLISEIRCIADVQKVYFTGVEVEQKPSIAITGSLPTDSYGGARRHKLQVPKAPRAVIDRSRPRTEP